ncbi:MAG: hypothetical protein RX318_09525 [bacterium]|nr:hypothetical protein [bacterium]
MSDESKDLVPAKQDSDTAIDWASVVISAVPYLGGPISSIRSGITSARKDSRIREVLEAIASDLKEFKSDASEKYTKTEDFEELFERTLRQVAEERNEKKRRIYKEFLLEAIKSPGEPYDEQDRHLRTLEEIQPVHLEILHAIQNAPEMGRNLNLKQHMMPVIKSFQTTLSRLVPDIPPERLPDLVRQLNSMLLTTLEEEDDWQGLGRLPHTITPYGHRFMKFIIE